MDEMMMMRMRMRMMMMMMMLVVVVRMRMRMRTTKRVMLWGWWRAMVIVWPDCDKAILSAAANLQIMLSVRFCKMCAAHDMQTISTRFNRIQQVLYKPIELISTTVTSNIQQSVASNCSKMFQSSHATPMAFPWQRGSCNLGRQRVIVSSLTCFTVEPGGAIDIMRSRLREEPLKIKHQEWSLLVLLNVIDGYWWLLALELFGVTTGVIWMSLEQLGPWRDHLRHFYLFCDPPPDIGDKWR